MRLRDARRQRFLSVRDLAKAAGVSTATIVAAESGRNVPYFGTARKIAAALSMSPADIDEFAARLNLGDGETGKAAA